MWKIISQPSCRYCVRAKELLTNLGKEFCEETLLTKDQKDAFKANGHRTVPQIWEGERYVGGWTELAGEFGVKP